MNGRTFWCRLISVSILACGLIVGTAAAAEVKFFRQQSMESFQQGTLEGVGVDASGRLQLADEVERLVDIDEPFLFAAAEHPEGWVVGTGNSGKVLLLNRRGELTTLFPPRSRRFSPSGSTTTGRSSPARLPEARSTAGRTVS